LIIFVSIIYVRLHMIEHAIDIKTKIQA